MTRSCLLALMALGMLLLSASASALDQRFYFAPMFTYGFFSNDTFEPDDQLGAQYSIGKTLTKYLALELYAFHYNDVALQGPGNVDNTGIGLSALLFPARNVVPIFGIVGVGKGWYDFDGVGTEINEQDASFVDFGVGLLTPIADTGIKLRSEVRYRSSDVDAVDGGEHSFHNVIVSIGLQVPLGSKPQPKPEPSVQPTPMPMPAPEPPEPADSDGDGVPDSHDRCPGTASGAEVNRFGCPKADGEPIVLKGVTFEFDSAALTAQARDRLENVVNALKSEPGIEVIIAGHTDSIGSAAYNMDLSRRRAMSVKAFLVAHGIDADRLRIKAYGETRPIAPNTTAAGRARNRRVELHVVDFE